MNQRLMNLERANEIRALRSQDKARIASRELRASDVLLNPPDHWCSAKAFDLLDCLPFVGPQKAGTVLRRHHISTHRLVRDLTARERIVLAGEALVLERRLGRFA